MLTKYNILSKGKYSYSGFSLQKITNNDIEDIREWRNQQMPVHRRL